MMDTIQITLAIAAATFAAAVTFAKANADAVENPSVSPTLLAGEASPRGTTFLPDRHIAPRRGVSIILKD